MAKFLWQVSYTTQGVQGVVKEGGSSRRAMVNDLVAGLGGTLEAFYYAFGDDDVYVIADLPDNVTAAAVSLAVGASGGATPQDGRVGHARGDRRGHPEGGRLPGSGSLTDVRPASWRPSRYESLSGLRMTDRRDAVVFDVTIRLGQRAHGNSARARR